MTANEKRNAVVKAVLSREGKNKYTQDGNLRLKVASGYSDCSSLVQWAYHQVGIEAGGWTGAQRKHGTRVTASLNTALMLPGDLVFYTNPGHVEMYVGNSETSGHGDGIGPRRHNINTYRTGDFAEVRRYIAGASKDEWIKQDGKWWYRHADGSYTKNEWEKIKNKWYYFDESGWMKVGWITYKKKKYYCGADGAMLSNCWLDGSPYYLGADGAMLTNTFTPDGRYMNADGIGVNSYTIKYNAANGSGTMADTFVIYGVNKPLRANTFKRTGYKFTGWTVFRHSDKKLLYVKADGKTTNWFEKDKQPGEYASLYVYPDKIEVSKTCSGDRDKDRDIATMYAQWKANTYNVQYDSNGGSGTMDDTKITYGVKKPLRENAFKRTGYQFTGWTANRHSDKLWRYIKEGSKSEWCEEGKQPSGYAKFIYKDKLDIAKTSSVNKDTVTMYAQWKANTYNVIYDSNGGSGTMDDTKITYGVKKPLRENAFKRTGYQFTGWTANRHSDKLWRYIKEGSKSEWCEEDKQPSGYAKFIYKDKLDIAKTSSVNKDTVTMYAQWKAE